MTARAWFHLGFVMIGTFFLASAFANAPNALAALVIGGMEGYTAVGFLNLAFHVLVGLFLVMKSSALSASLAREHDGRGATRTAEG